MAKKSPPAPKTPDAKAEPGAPSSSPANIELIDMEAAIERLKTTRPTFYRWLKEGKLKGMKVGRQWRFYKRDIEAFLKGEEPQIESAADMTPFLNQLRAFEERLTGKAKPPYAEGNAVTALNVLLLVSIGHHASDIHVTPLIQPGSTEPQAVTSIRIDGVLQTAAATELRLLRPLVERIKMMSHLDLNERRLPQDGRVELQAGGKPYDLRVTILPTSLGEAATIRVLPQTGYDFSLDRMSYPKPVRDRIETFLARPWGLLAFTGPAGSGKTTTLYAGLTHLAGPACKVISIENPVEVALPHVVQLPVRPERGLTFAALVRSALRAAPNVISIAEIPDAETFDLAMEAALTGHLVLTTMHTEDAANALIRMVQVCSNAALASDATKLIVAQRLVRKLCPDCSVSFKPPAHELDRAETIARSGGINGDLPAKNFRSAKGCEKCSHSGYRGRILMAEALEISPEIAGALQRNASAEQLRSIAIEQGMIAFGADGVRLAAEGRTTLEEVLRHIPPQKK